jgi:aquaporin Z
VRAKLLTEFVGTFIFLSVIALSGNAGVLAPLAIGIGLTAMVYMGGHVSGAHYNPAVSFALFLRRVIPAATMVQYWVVQLVAGILAFSAAFAISGRHAAIHPGVGDSVWAALTAEIVFTTALVLVILNVAATKETAGNSYYGIAIGFTVATGAFVVGPISGAAFNPAVGLAATFSGAVFGHDSWTDVWIYFVGPLVGGAIGAGIHYLQARPGPVPVETAEREHPG